MVYQLRWYLLYQQFNRVEGLLVGRLVGTFAAALCLSTSQAAVFCRVVAALLDKFHLLFHFRGHQLNMQTNWTLAAFAAVLC